MSDLQIDPSTNDLAIVDGDLAIVGGTEAIAQQLRIRLRMFRGEWFADSRVGLPYYQQIFVKNPNLAAVRSLYSQAILSTPGVLEILALNLDLDSAARKLSLSFRARIDGSDVPLEYVDEFVITGA